MGHGRLPGRFPEVFPRCAKLFPAWYDYDGSGTVERRATKIFLSAIPSCLVMSPFVLLLASGGEAELRPTVEAVVVVRMASELCGMVGRLLAPRPPSATSFPTRNLSPRCAARTVGTLVLCSQSTLALSILPCCLPADAGSLLSLLAGLDPPEPRPPGHRCEPGGRASGCLSGDAPYLSVPSYLSPGGDEGTYHASRHPPPSGGSVLDRPAGHLNAQRCSFTLERFLRLPLHPRPRPGLERLSCTY